MLKIGLLFTVTSGHTRSLHQSSRSKAWATFHRFQGPVNYNWEYAVLDDKYNDFGHKENRDGYAATGKYYVNLPDGRTQIVTYTADANGYTPVVEYSGVAQYPEAVKPTYN